MFLGAYAHNLDGKGRLAIPARFRDGLASGSVLTRGADQCLVIYPADVWRALCDKIGELPLSDRDARMYRRFLFADAAVLDLDGQGRILVPATLRRFAGLDRSAIVVGVDNVIEIWSADAWRSIYEGLDAQSDEISSRLALMI